MPTNGHVCRLGSPADTGRIDMVTSFAVADQAVVAYVYIAPDLH